MKKALLVISLLTGINSSSFASVNNNVRVITYTVSRTSGIFEYVSVYSFIDFNGNGCRDQWETNVLMDSYMIEDLGNGSYWIHED